MKVELVKTYDEGLIKQLVELEEEAFPMYMWTKNIEDYYRECLQDTNYINVVMFNNENRLAG